MKRFKDDNRGVALQILQGMAFLGSVLLLYFIFLPLMLEMSDVTHTLTEDTHYYEDSVNMLDILTALSQEGLLVVAVVSVTLFLLHRAVLMTNHR